MKKELLVFSAAAVMAVAASPATAATVDELQQQIDTLSSQVKALKEKTPAVEESGALKKAWDQTRIGGYGELSYAFKRENGNGQGGNYFDPQRFVLYVNSDLNDWITLNSELEWEHGGSDGGADGGVAVEQAFLDFKLHPAFNIKAGAMLVPLGAINLYHEPTNFNSTQRPQVDRFLIPSTWQEVGLGIHGRLGERANYQLMVSPGLNGEGFSAENGVREGRQDFGKDSNRNLAVSGRVEVTPLKNLYTNFSFFTGNSAPSGSPTAFTTIAAFDGKYSIGDFDLMGEYVHVIQDNPGALTPSEGHAIGHQMSGYWVEGAYHVMPKSWQKGKLADADLVGFARYSELDTLKGSSDAAGSFAREYTTFGVVFKPTTTVAIKADYQIYHDRRPDAEKLDNDKAELMVGFVF